MDNDLIVYKVRPNYFDEYSKDDLVFLSTDALAMYLNWTNYPCTVSTVRKDRQCITTSS
jgi:hypothetical protein